MNIQIETEDASRTPHLQAKNLQLYLRNRMSEQPQTYQVKDSPSIYEKINSNGIVSPFRLILTACLIFCSIFSISNTSDAHWKHAKGILFYFNYYVLGNQDLGIYDNDDNIDECAIEIVMLDEMIDHFNSVADFSQSFSEEGFPVLEQEQLLYQNGSEPLVVIQRYTNENNLTVFRWTIEEFKEFIETPDLRDFLLDTDIMRIKIGFGSNKKVADLWVIYEYQVYSELMMSVDLSIQYSPHSENLTMKTVVIYRAIEMLMAVMLFISYSVQARKIYYSKSLPKQFRKNTLYWCLSLLFLNFGIITSETLAPMCSFLQLLPVFENHDSSNTLTFNFNVNLRYSLPMVFGVLLPVYIFMNGYIFYSMIVYPGDYFDDYVTSFFSYFYNMFQYGTYEIFTELKDKGNFAYCLYVVLYFYMVLVATNLLPALFCTLIYRRINERELIRYIEGKIRLLVCPKCSHSNYEHERTNYSLQIKSPKSPYLKTGTKLVRKKDKSPSSSPSLSPIQSPHTHFGHKNSNRKNSDMLSDNDSESEMIMTQMFIEDQLSDPTSKLQYIKNRNKKIKELGSELEVLLEKSYVLFKKNEAFEGERNKWTQERMGKVEGTLQILRWKK